MCGKSAYDWKTVLTFRLCGGSLSTRWPWIQIVPCVGATKPPTRFSVVVLPHPEGPRRQKNSPSEISRSVGWRATWFPYFLETPRSSIPCASSPSGRARGTSTGSTATGSAIPTEPERYHRSRPALDPCSRRPPPGGEEHLRQHVDVEARLFRRRAARLAFGHAPMEVVELAGETLAVELRDSDVVGRAVPLAAAVDGRVLLEPGRGEG